MSSRRSTSTCGPPAPTASAGRSSREGAMGSRLVAILRLDRRDRAGRRPDRAWRQPWPRSRPGQLPRPSFTSSVDIVSVDVNVIDRNGRPVRDLAAGDFTLSVDGTAAEDRLGAVRVRYRPGDRSGAAAGGLQHERRRGGRTPDRGRRRSRQHRARALEGRARRGGEIRQPTGAPGSRGPLFDSFRARRRFHDRSRRGRVGAAADRRTGRSGTEHEERRPG